MAGNRGLFILPDGSSNGTTPLNARLALTGLIAGDGSGGLSIRSGAFYDGLGPIVVGNTDTGTMSYSVRAAVFTFPLLGTASSGAVVAANDAVFKATTTAAPGSNSRIDVIWVRQHAVASDGGPDTDNILEIKVTQGTAAASPTVPAIPTGAMAIAQAVMTSGSTSTNALAITQVHGWAASAGAPLAIRNSTERGTLTPFAGMSIYRIDTGNLEVYSGTAWELLKPSLTTAPTITWASSGTQPTLGNGTLTCTFTDDGEWCDFDILLTIGSTSTAGSGGYSFTGLPFAAAGGSSERWYFQGQYTDISAGNFYPMLGQVIGGTTTVNFLSNAFPTGAMTAAAPVVPAVGDAYHVNGRYRR